MDRNNNNETIETPCPLCCEFGIYIKLLRLDLFEHLNKKHSKKMLASFVGREAHFSRRWDMSEEACLQKSLDFNVKVVTEAFKILGRKKNAWEQSKLKSCNSSPRTTEPDK